MLPVSGGVRKRRSRRWSARCSRCRFAQFTLQIPDTFAQSADSLARERALHVYVCTSKASTFCTSKTSNLSTSLAPSGDALAREEDEDQFTCFISTKLQILTPAFRAPTRSHASARASAKTWRRRRRRRTVAGSGMDCQQKNERRAGTHFTCFTSTKVQILTRLLRRAGP